MSGVESSRSMRAIWPLGKVRVIEINDTEVTLSFDGKAKIIVSRNNPHLYDIRLGDLLPLYTEVLLAKHS
jgi:hypothetical protein